MNPNTHPTYAKWRCLIAACFGCALHVAGSGNAYAAPVVTSATGSLASDVQPAVANFRTLIGFGGGNNGVGGGPFANGFRNINWDVTPALVTDPNLLPGNFFNANSPRGLLMTTPGSGFLVSADAGGLTPAEFGSIDPSYLNTFQAFSAQRLFTALGSTITNNTFFVPSSPGTPASVFGFGVVFSDVDITGSTSLTFFDINGAPLGVFNAPVFNNGFSFIGVSFDAGERIGSVRVNSGSDVLGFGVGDGGAIDVVAMDDFMYSEPQAVVPEPGTTALILLGVGSVAALRRRPPVTAFG